MRFGRDLAGSLARQLHDVLRALLVFVPEVRPFFVKGAFFRGSDHRLIRRSDLGVCFYDSRQGLFRGLLFLQRLAQHVFADHVAVGDDAGAQVAEHADARQPAGRDVDRVGVDRPHVADRKQAHAVIATSSKATTVMILARIEYFASMGRGLLVLDAGDASGATRRESNQLRE
jgi:hypothetical protein